MKKDTKDNLSIIQNSQSKTPAMIGRIAVCSTCGRKILVEKQMAGVDHDVKIIVNCWGCLDDESRSQAITLYNLPSE